MITGDVLRVLFWLALFACGAAAGWFVQSHRLEAARSAHAAEMALLHLQLGAARESVIRNARETERFFQEKLNEANHEHARAMAQSDDDLRRAYAELDRLRQHVIAAASGAGMPADSAPAACDCAAATELLADCAGSLVDVARAADRHAADARRLHDGWPQ